MTEFSLKSVPPGSFRAGSIFASESNPTVTKVDLIEVMQQLLPPGSPDPIHSTTLNSLKQLTQQLIQAYQAEGALQEDPFADVRTRQIHLYSCEVKARLQNKVILVTGGEGCVGRHLVQKLSEFGVQRIISVDKARCQTKSETQFFRLGKVEIVQHAIDIRDRAALEQVFAVEKPQIVFHLAAQRLPGLAEIQIRETVSSNVFGTRNIIQLCEQYGVEQCVFSSTGKASRYYTAEVYAASKKMAEWQFAQAAQTGTVTYSMVRFTHMLENSSFCQQYDDKIALSKPVNVHAPHRYIVGQNVSEALHLLLNALIITEPKKLKFVLCRNLGWPVETLEVALYKILKSEQEIPLYFQGVLPGYEEPFFRGQVDWSNPSEMNTLINVIECQSKTTDPFGDMIIADCAGFSFDLLNQHLNALEAVVNLPEQPEQLIKEQQAIAIREIANSTFIQTSPKLLFKILKWGIDPKYFESSHTTNVACQEIIQLLLNGLYAGLAHNNDIYEQIPQREFRKFLNLLFSFPLKDPQISEAESTIEKSTVNCSLSPLKTNPSTEVSSIFTKLMQIWDTALPETA